MDKLFEISNYAYYMSIVKYKDYKFRFRIRHSMDKYEETYCRMDMFNNGWIGLENDMSLDIKMFRNSNNDIQKFKEEIQKDNGRIIKIFEDYITKTF